MNKIKVLRLILVIIIITSIVGLYYNHKYHIVKRGMNMLRSSHPFSQQPAYDELNSYVENKYNYLPIFDLNQYAQILDELKDPKFEVMPFHEFIGYKNKEKVVLTIKHDMDVIPLYALKMAKLEKDMGIRSTYYVLQSVDYYGGLIDGKFERYTCLDTLYKSISAMGHEMGIHNDLITMQILYNVDPKTFFLSEIDYFKSLGIPVYGTSSHGYKRYKKIKIANYQIFSDFQKDSTFVYKNKKYRIGQYSLKECGFEYEVYHIPYDHYYSDSGRKWNEPDRNHEPVDIFQKLRQAKKGERIVLLVHPDLYKSWQ